MRRARSLCKVSADVHRASTTSHASSRPPSRDAHTYHIFVDPPTRIPDEGVGQCITSHTHTHDITYNMHMRARMYHRSGIDQCRGWMGGTRGSLACGLPLVSHLGGRVGAPEPRPGRLRTRASPSNLSPITHHIGSHEPHLKHLHLMLRPAYT